MKRTLFFWGMAIVLAWSQPGFAKTIGFDDLSYGAVPSGYQGFNWSNYYVLNGTGYPAGYGYHIGVASAPNIVYNGYGGTTTITAATSGGVFNPVSAVFTASTAANAYLTIIGWLGGSKVYSIGPAYTSIYPVAHSYQQLLYSFPIMAVDKLEISSGSNIVAMDNFKVNEAATPIPGAAWLLGAGVAGLAALRKKFRA